MLEQNVARERHQAVEQRILIVAADCAAWGKPCSEMRCLLAAQIEAASSIRNGMPVVDVTAFRQLGNAVTHRSRGLSTSTGTGHKRLAQQFRCSAEYFGFS